MSPSPSAAQAETSAVPPPPALPLPGRRSETRVALFAHSEIRVGLSARSETRVGFSEAWPEPARGVARRLGGRVRLVRGVGRGVST